MKRLLSAVVIPIVAMAAIATALLLEFESLGAAVQSADLANQQISASRELIKLVIDMETGLRGYLFTGDAVFLQPYTDATQVIEAKFAALHRLTSGDPFEEAQLAITHSSVEQWRQLATVAIGRRTGASAEGSEETRTRLMLERKAEMDGIRAKFDVLTSHELLMRSQSVARVRSRSWLAGISCLLLAFGCGGSLGLFIIRRLRSRAADLQRSREMDRAAAALAIETVQRDKEEAVADYRGQIEAISRSQMMIEFDMDGTILKANDNYLHVFFYSREELEGQEHSILVTGEYKRSAEYKQFWEDLRHGKFQCGEYRRVGKTGQDVWVDASYNPICDADGHPVRIVKFATDVTDRVRIRSDFRDAETRLRAILDNVLDGILTINASGTIVSLNPGVEKMFEYRAEDLIGQNIRSLMPEPDRSNHDSHLARYQTTNTTTMVIGVGRELEGISRTGRIFPIEVTVTEVSLHGERLFVGLIRDITERKAAEEERSRHENALRKSEELLDRTGRLARVGGWEVDLVTNAVNWSAETARLHGVDPEYRPTFEDGINFYAPEARPAVKAAMEKAISNGQGWELEAPLIRADGRRIWARVIASVELAGGRPVRIVGAFQDITARKQAEETLRDQANLLDLSHDSIIVRDLSGRICFWNHGAEEMYGHSRQEAGGQVTHDLLRTVFPRPLAEIDAQLLREERWEGELEHTTQDGARIWVASRWVLKRDDHGPGCSVLEMNNDITERKRAEQASREAASALAAEQLALQEANRRVALATEGGGIGIWDWDLPNNRFTLDDRMYRLYGLEPEISRSTDLDFWLRRVHPEDQAAIGQALQDCIDGTRPYDMEFRNVWDDGSVHFIKATGQAIRDHAGHAIRMVGTNFDITERKQAEEALRQAAIALEAEQLALQNANRRVTLATDSGGIGIWEWDIRKDILIMDDRMYRLYGLDPNITGPVGLDFWVRHLHPEDRPAVEQAVRDGIEGIRPYDTEFRIVWDDGSVHFIKATGHVTSREAGHATRMVGTNFDITQRKQTEEAAQQARLAAEEANRVKSSFLANMSHEVRTPVNAIVGMAHLALRAGPDPRQRGYLTKIETAAQALLSIMNDILDFSRIEAGKLVLECITFSLDDVLNDLRDLLGPQAEQKHLPILFSVVSGVPRYLTGDPLRLGQILINLVNNAIKFTDEGEIVVKVAKENGDGDPGRLKFSVSDTGIGMSPEQVANLFQSFRQADSSFTRKYGGTGLGLAISKQLSELMEGTISVESAHGAGTTFHFTATFGVATQCALAPAHARRNGLAGKSVLVVDDSENARVTLVAMLRAHHLDAQEVSSGEETLIALVSASQGGRPFDLVLMDWRLPGINGIETSRRIKTHQNLSRIPAVLIFSAFERDEVMNGLDDGEVEGFLMKPLEEGRTMETINAILNAAPDTSPRLPQSPRDAGTLAGRRVLLVEDNQLNRDLATELLADLGISVTAAVNGREGVDRVAAEPFDLVLMDIQMPVMDGLTAARLIRADGRFPHLPIVAMTAHAMSGDRARSLEAGMNDHITKPISFDGLTKTLIRWMPAAPPNPPDPPGPDPDAVAAQPPQPAAREELPAQLPPFDLAAALARANGKPTLLRKLILGFRDQYADAVFHLRRDLRENRPEEAERLVHSLKSIAAMLEAGELAEAAAAVEAALRGGHPEALPGLIEGLEKSLGPAIAAASLLDRRMRDQPDNPAPFMRTEDSLSVRPSILAVDDQSSILELLIDTFHDDYEVLLAKDGGAALEMASRRMPDIILLDVNMPGMDGYEVCRRLKEEPRTREIPVIFLTGSGDVESETKGLELGAADYVTKPMNPAAVKARVHSQIKFKKAQAELLRLSAKEHLDEMVDELERSAAKDRNRELQLKMKDDFLSHVSHELRSPLTSIDIFVNLIADRLAGEITPQQDEYLHIILSNAAHLKSMIEDLLEATRLGTGKLSIKLQSASIAEAAAFAIHTLEGLADAKSIALSCHVPGDLSSACADPTRLRQILIVFIDNALKFTPPGGAVRVAARVFEGDASFLLVEVSDTGCGISPELTETIFERLYQCPQPEQKGRQGLGLGLHIARELVQRQGGRIWVNSVLGEGSQFCFTVPIFTGQSNLSSPGDGENAQESSAIAGND